MLHDAFRLLTHTSYFVCSVECLIIGIVDIDCMARYLRH